MIKKYRKKPVVIEAVEFKYTSECLEYLKQWLDKEFKGYGKARNPHAVGWLEIGTLEDGMNQVKHIAFEGDYIIRGVKGEFYPCKPHIFNETYEEE
jgi:uncharacterized Zn finger protein